MESLKKRVLAREIFITETDKSWRFCILTPKQYIDSGLKHKKGDIQIYHDQLNSIPKTLNDHSAWMRKIFGIGVNSDHSERLDHGMTDKREVVVPLHLLVKDRKGWSQEDGATPPPSRPVCSGNKGFNRHLSEILSMILESVGHSIDGNEIDSTSELLHEVNKLNLVSATENKHDGTCTTFTVEKKFGESSIAPALQGAHTFLEKNFGVSPIMPTARPADITLDKNFGESSIAPAIQETDTSIEKNFGEGSIAPTTQGANISLEKNFGEISIVPVTQSTDITLEKNFEESSIKTTTEEEASPPNPEQSIQNHRSKHKPDMVTFGRELKMSRVNRLRELRAKHCPVPNFRSKLWALRILD